ncbi:polysaccharide biosynthesis/export family protein [Falsihalocynthiibacter arcticus]|uniref:Sugar ABC transporter substrate-binding protein n=1 Tax=Falsihalocynthiibacter arcticus TaxID=1579316 RepID=A0A126V005_9RHOB|nr:polysaccharide biosynthesis/export family protein [Falsihalocynthiibacter arcticus]AML51651.1 sugar ABC transporter substrate-binding protein [Falsihalocynthiibacter arcticus]
MSILASKGVRSVALFALVTALASCTLPRSGPNKNEIYSGSVLKQGDAFVVTVNDRVTRATSVTPALGFSAAFKNAGLLGSDTIRSGDVLGVSVWENTDVPILGAPQVATILEEIQVDGQGFIFVPYAGRIKADGNTPEQLRNIITRKLDQQTPDPQVSVRRLAGDGSTVSIVGGVGAQGVYPIERPTRTLSAMLARASGVTIEPEIAQITVTRNGLKDRIWLQDLYENPEMDIALRGGDKILVEKDNRAFTALGAMGTQSRVTFESQTVSAIEALALVGGLNSNLADPKGIFIFRNEPQEISNVVLGRNDLQGDQRFIYVIDLTAPNGMFQARDFAIRENDTVYVTEAPYVRLQKTLGAIIGPVADLAVLDGAF